MAKQLQFSSAALKVFEAAYDTSYEDDALQSRGQFLQDFPIRRLKNLTLDEYVIGLGTPTFCSQVEAKTIAWAQIQGATAIKFGVYFGRTKTDPIRRYRYAVKYGNSTNDAFGAVKEALLALVKEGKKSVLDFQAIDANPLSPMFKAKILSLYFPERFFNVCSPEHLEILAGELGISENLYVSENQYLLVQAKLTNPMVANWSNPKFMAFLYATYLPKTPATPKIRPPRSKGKAEVNFDDIQDLRNKFGKAAEKFALLWEKERLKGRGWHDLTSKIENRCKRPGYGYDFLSFSSPGVERFIEVKSVGKITGGYRFFLSGNEDAVSRSAEHEAEYYFYLVRFDKKGVPFELKAIRAKEIYKSADIVPASYMVRFDF